MLIMDSMNALYERIVDPALLIRRINITANHIVPESEARQADDFFQLDLFSDSGERLRAAEAEQLALEREKRRQKTIVALKDKYGKNAVLRGTNFMDGATTIARNSQIGGHKA